MTKTTIILASLLAIFVSTSSLAQNDGESKKEESSQPLKLDFGSLNPLVFVDGVLQDRDYLERELKPDQIATVNVIKGEAAIKKYGDKASNGVVEVITKKGLKSQKTKIKITTDQSFKDQSIFYLIDGKPVSQEKMESLNPEDIQSIDVIKDKDEIAKYTSASYDGIVRITLKKK